MFPRSESRLKTAFRRSLDAAIDFATLGEYGLEEVEQRSLPCEARHRSGRSRSTGAWNSAIARFATQS
jgi:hypothetical protein